MDFNTSQPHYEPGVIKIYSQDFGEMQKQLTRLSNEVLELRKRVEHLEAKTKSPVVVDELGYTSRHPQLVVAQDQFRVIGKRIDYLEAMRKANERPKDFYAWLCRQYWTKEVLEISYANTLPPDAAEAFRIFPIAYNALNLLAEQPGRVIRTVDEADNRNVARDVFLAVSKHCRYRACEKLKREEAIANALAYPMVEVKEELGSSGDDFMN